MLSKEMKDNFYVIIDDEIAMVFTLPIDGFVIVNSPVIPTRIIDIDKYKLYRQNKDGRIQSININTNLNAKLLLANKKKRG